MFCCCRKLCSISDEYTLQTSRRVTTKIDTSPLPESSLPDHRKNDPEPKPPEHDKMIKEDNEKVPEGISGSDNEITEESQGSDNEIDNEERDVNEIKEEKRVGIISKIIIDDKKEIKKYVKTSSELNLIKNAISSNQFLSNVIDDGEIEEIVESMYLRELERNDVIIKQGDDGDFICISAGGSFDVVVDGQIVNQFDNYRVFGEHAILYNAKRNATIRCTSNCKVWILDRNVFQRVIIRSIIKEQNEYFIFLKNVPTINQASDDKLRRVANLLKKEFFTMNTNIVVEGDPGDKFYIVRAGTVHVSKIATGTIATLTKGQFFGERALIKEDKRAATVTADPPGVECLSLDRHDFIKHFGDMKDFFKEPEKKPEIIKTVPREYEDIEIRDLKIIGTLGIGGFGRVEFVKHKTNPKIVFALKYLKKADMVQQQQQEHAINEKKIQMACDTIFIVKLYKTFKDAKYLYLLMESCLGGDLWGLLQRQKNHCFNETHSRFYAACVIEALTYLHDRNYIYRDLKPENLMLDAQGYLKLTDFGFAKEIGPHEKTFTFAGTPEYVAPEIVLQRGHDKAVDYWAIGIFIYELLAGKTPFKSNDSSHLTTYNLIIGGIDNVRFPSNFVKSAQHLVKGLCRPSAIDRMGCQRKGADVIRNHKWFLGFNWDQLRAKTMKAPYTPKLRNEYDLRYFDTFKKDNDIPPKDETGWDADF